ncbi:hypothetical protein ATCC90586_009990 [Pythium insidiosum]|nr:hypothetical protein ATCC90586_009990 [Pythium insidiosum]
MFPLHRCAATLALTATAICWNASSACSDVLLNTSIASNIISARTMDFAPDLRTAIEVIPANTTFQELPVRNCVDCPDYSWQSKYGFVALNVVGMNVAADGLNERGLSAAMLWLDATEYPKPHVSTGKDDEDDDDDQSDSTKPIVTFVCSYLLGNYATVDEVRKGLDTFQVGEFDERIVVPLLHHESIGRLPLHVSVHDASGESLVIEFLKGKTKVYDNINDVLTNDPPLSKQLEALEENGFKHYPGGYGSDERFLRLSVLNRGAYFGYRGGQPEFTYMAGSEEQQGVAAAVHLINTVVRVPNDEATQWTVIRDHARRKLYVQTTQNQVLRQVDLNALDFTNSKSRRLIPVSFGDWFVDITPALTDVSNDAKTVDLPPRTQLEQLLEELIRNGSIPRQTEIPSPKTQDLVAQPSSSSSGFMVGILMGAALAMAGMTVFKALQRGRRSEYRRIPDPETASYSA